MVVQDFEWSGTTPTCSTDYLLAPILSELRRVGAKRVSDLGCGNGGMTHIIQKHGFDVVGCDPSPTGIQFARKTPSGAQFFQIGLEESPAILGDAAFDAAICTEVVCQMLKPRILPQFAAQILKPNGQLIISTPYHGYLKNILIALSGKWDLHHGALNDMGHVKYWSYRTLSQLLAEHGFIVERFLGAGRAPFLWRSMVVSARRK